MSLRDRVSGVLHRARAARRRAWRGPERVWVEIRPIPLDGTARVAALVEARLGAMPGVRWARLNAALGRVVIQTTADGPDEHTLRDAVEQIEEEAGLGRKPLATDPRSLPFDGATERRLRAEIATDAVSMVAGLIPRWGKSKREATKVDIAAALRVIEDVPELRRVIDGWFGVASADFLLGVSNAVSSASLNVVSGPVTDIVYRSIRMRGARAARGVWEAREPELGGRPDVHPDRRVDAPVRPASLPDGPIETYATRAMMFSVGGSGVTVMNSRRLDTAAATLIGGVPRPAHHGRKAFAASIAERLSARGFLVMDARALRRLDRLDTLVVHGVLLAPVGGELVHVRGVGDADAEEARRRATLLFDPAAPFAVRQDDGWTLGPLSALHLGIDRDLADALRAAAAPGGRLLGIVHGTDLHAVIAVRPEIDVDAETLVTAARAAGLKLVVVSDHPDLVAWSRPDVLLPEGADLLPGLRLLQEERHGLCLVWRGHSDALLHADLSVGLPEGGDTPWQAHVIAPASLSELPFLISAIEAAHRVAYQSVQIAILESVTGVALSLQSPTDSPSRRALALSNLASLVAMGNSLRVSHGLTPPERARRRDHTPWHAMDAAAIFEKLDSSVEGLSTELARARRQPAPPAPTDWQQVQRVLGEELDNPLAPVLAAGAALSALTGSKIDAAMVGSVLALNGVIGAAQRVRAERALSELDRQESRHVRVRRGGQWTHAPSVRIVPGDVIALQAGELIPADCRVLEANGLEVDESALTGESIPVSKSTAPTWAPYVADRASMLFAGTTIAAGDALAVVVAAGEDTEARAAVSSATRRAPRGVEARLNALTGLTAPVAALAGVALLASGLSRGGPPRELISSAVSLSVAAVPEGLPLLAMVAQLAAARRLAARGALARNPRAIEALGRVDVLCADKTGTLTEGHLRVTVVSDGRVEAALDALPEHLMRVLSAATRATPAPHDTEPLPHPTDQAVVEGWSSATSHAPMHAPVRRAELPFEPGRGWHATLSESIEGLRLDVKGSPEAVLARCDRALTQGRTRALSTRERARLLSHASAMGDRGLRVLAVAHRDVAGAQGWIHTEDVEGLVFLGFLGIADPPRATAMEAVSALGRAGVAVVMITGDHASTAGAIGRSIGLEVDRVVTGAELEMLGDDALDALLPVVRVFARVTPAQKVRLVRGFQRLGHVVAMTGDGANDAPAIRQSDVGIALGERATMAARHAAALVVADGRIETIVAALLEGRALWASVRDAVGMLVGSNLGEVAYTLFGGLVTGRVPLNARQLLLVNLFTDALPALALAARPPNHASPEALAKAGPDVSLGAALERDIAWRAVFTATAAGAGWSAARWTLGRRGADTVGLLSLVGTQLGQTMLLADGSVDVMLTSLGSLGLLLVVVEFPPTSYFFGCRPLGPFGLAQAGAAAALGTVAAAVVPAAVDRFGGRLQDTWRREHMDENELVRWIAESRTLHRLVERGAALRAATRGQTLDEEPA